MNKERLLKLADHLEHGKLGHQEFDFRYYNADNNGLLVRNACGTAGCALGECPVVWPDEWKFGNYGVQLHDHGSPQADDSAMQFFDLGQAEVDHLFYSEMQRPEKYGGEVLYRTATKEDVAANIRAFVEKRERE